MVSIDEAQRNDLCPNEVGPGVSEGALAENVQPLDIEAPSDEKQKSCRDEAGLSSEDQNGLILGQPETQICQGTIESRTLNLDAHDQVSATETNVLRPCSSIQDQDGALKPAVSPTYDGDVNSVINIEATDGGEETAKLGLSTACKTVKSLIIACMHIYSKEIALYAKTHSYMLSISLPLANYLSMKQRNFLRKKRSFYRKYGFLCIPSLICYN